MAATAADRDTGRYSLDWVLAPVTGEEFRSRYWEKEPLFLKRGKPGYYAEVFGFADMDRALYLSRHSTSDPITVIPPPGSGRNQQRLRAGKVAMSALYNTVHRGDSLRLTAVQEFWPAVARLAATLQEDLDARVNVNSYLTRSGSQGFPLHYDTHDVLVLQVGGAKTWWVYEPVVPLPVGSLEYAGKVGEGFHTRPPEDQAQLRAEYRLESGDVLYLPRGFLHKAVASDEPSLHLTVGIHPFYWVDALKAALDLLARRRPELRGALPASFMGAGEPPPEVEARFRELLDLMGSEASFLDARRALRKAHHEERFEPPDGHIEDLVTLDALTAESWLERREGIACAFSTENGTARLDFGENFVSGPSHLAPALEFVVRRRRFQVTEMPDSLSANSKLVLAKRLVREGLLRTVREA
jgi:ribosomal protein L16 Arg81 hydroxylase